MRNQYKILAEKYDQVNQEEGRKPGTPKVTSYTKSDGSTAYKSLDEWGHRKDWRTSAAAHKAAGIPEPKPTNEIASNIGNKDPLFNKASMLLKSFYAQGYLDPAISLYGEELVTDAINKCKTINDVFQLFIVYKIINPNTPFNVFTDMVKNAPVGIP